ncbi:LysR family transcriptional regulator [Parashewanella curva]|uniref:LysR family transcriptional regulator n=1 Tax=Parashewanella curva TaxID=2338552 RepID=A0A3L8Q0G6_9GAMM|nr:LysR family transcriptional regulator [Parashewanella curva]RLV59852.1 LysR family transcriptional regulator [Parashewanella curva]
MLNPHWLRTFKTLIDIGSFTQAAEKLFMTQPGVSQHIQKLEDMCGYTLIKRQKRSFEITAQGKLVYQYALDIERNEQNLLSKLSFNEPYSGQYRIACSGAFSLLLYPHLVELQKQYPLLTPSVEVAPNHKIFESISVGNVDFGLVTQLPDPIYFDFEVIGRERLCLFVPSEGLCHNIEKLVKLGFISHPDATHYLKYFMSECGHAELSKMNTDDFPISGYINQLAQILTPVANGIGFTVLPESVRKSCLEAQNLMTWDIGKPVYETVFLVKKKDYELPVRCNTVIKLLKGLTCLRGE